MLRMWTGMRTCVKVRWEDRSQVLMFLQPDMCSLTLNASESHVRQLRPPTARSVSS